MINLAVSLLLTTNAFAQMSPQINPSNPSFNRQPTGSCPVQTCKETKEVDVCFMGFEPNYSEGLKQLAYQKTCGWDAISFQTRTPEELRSAIAELGQKCVKIKKFTLASHGMPGAVYLFAQPAQPITIKNLKSTLGMISCWTQKDSEVIASGCNTASGCAGDNFLYQTAKQLLPQGGKVRGSTALSGTFLPGLLPVMSSDLNKAQVTYDPLKNPSMTWQNRGELLGIETHRDASNAQCLAQIRDTARALGPSAAESSICSSQTDFNRTRREIDDVIDQLGGLPQNRFDSPGFVPLASRYQDLQGGVYAGSICDRSSVLGIQLPQPTQRPSTR